MKYWDLLKKLDQKKIDLIYHFTGEEEFLKNEAIGKLIGILVPDKLKSFNLNLLYASQIDVEQIINFCSTFPINNPKRLIVLYELDKLSPKHKDALLDFLKNIPKTACLVLVSGKIKLNSKFYKELEKIATTVQFNPFYDESQILDWITNQTKRCGKKIDYAASQLLYNSVGNNFSDLANEIEKLCSFLGNKEKIKTEDVELVVGLTKTTNVFELANSIGKKDVNSAILILEKLLLVGEKPVNIVHWINQHFVRIIKAKDFDPKKIAIPLSAFLGINPFFVKDYKSQAENFTVEELEQVFLFLHQADLEIKSNRLPNKLCLEILIYKLCNLKEQMSGEHYQGK